MSKYKFLYQEIDNLGYAVNKAGIRPNDAHIKLLGITLSLKMQNSYNRVSDYFHISEDSYRHSLVLVNRCSTY